MGANLNGTHKLKVKLGKNIFGCYSLIQQSFRNLTRRLAEIISVNNILFEPDLKRVHVSRVAVLQQGQTGDVVRDLTLA